MAEPTIKASSSLMLPPPPSGRSGNMLSPATTAPQKLSSSGSATGNPRNKCALKPGHSLMDWVRLGNSGADLAGTRGRVTPVSAEELARHNSRADAWLAIRGHVFNVTRYMDFHPGGVDELMRGVGCDATKLFDDVHAWVNYQQLLSKCYIGPLRPVAKAVDNDNMKSLQLKMQTDQAVSKTSVAGEVVPRFDWIDQRANITLYIYTRPCCNPGLVVRRKSLTQLELRVHIAHAVHSFTFDLHKAVEWPPPRAAQIGSETGKIELCLTKQVPEPWCRYGAHNTTKVLQNADDDNDIEFEVIKRTDFNHDSYELILQGARDVLMVLPLGYHVAIGAHINGNLVQRSYTPVNAKYLKAPPTSTNCSLNFLIKRYETGALSTHMHQLVVGATLHLSPPTGSLNLQQLLPHRRIALLAAGSGLTPCLSLITHLLRRNTNRLEDLLLFYFNKTEADIWCQEALMLQAQQDERFKITHILSQPDASWRGLTGHVSQELLTPYTDKKSPSSVSFFAVCGSRAFNQCVEELLQQLQIDADNLHIFQG